MTELWQFIGTGLCALCAAVVLREIRREYVPVFMAVFSAAALGLILPKIAAAADFVRECAELSGSGRIAPVVKALGITYLTSSAAELCRTCGEASVGNAMELFGKAEILLLCIPLFRELLGIALIG